MKLFIVATLFVAAVVAAPATPDGDAQTIYSDTRYGLFDGYSFAYGTSNGIALQEQAVLKNAGAKNEVIEVRGQYSYIGTDGKNYTITYVANEGGYQPQGAHIPL